MYAMRTYFFSEISFFYEKPVRKADYSRVDHYRILKHMHYYTNTRSLKKGSTFSTI